MTADKADLSPPEGREPHIHENDIREVVIRRNKIHPSDNETVVSSVSSSNRTFIKSKLPIMRSPRKNFGTAKSVDGSLRSASKIHFDIFENDTKGSNNNKKIITRHPPKYKNIKSEIKRGYQSLEAIEPPRCAQFFESISKILNFLNKKIVRQSLSRLIYILFYAFLVKDCRYLANNHLYNWLFLSGYLVMATEFVIFFLIHSKMIKIINEPKFWTPPVAAFILATLPVLDVMIYVRYIHDLNDLCSTSMWENIVRDEYFSSKSVDSAMLYAQLLIIALVIGRWIHRSDTTSRDANSMLLIAIIGAGADIVEILDIFETENLCWLKPIILFWMVIPIYDISILQFIIVLTEKKSRKIDKITGKDEIHWMFYTEAWGIFLTMVMQDLPFFFLRVSLMLMGDVTQTRVFFTCKNLLVCFLTVNRILVVRKNRGGFGNSLVWK